MPSGNDSVRQLERFFVKHKGMNPRVDDTAPNDGGGGGAQRESLVKEAAGEAGYRSLPHLCREFKKVHGITPSQSAYGIGFVNEAGR